MKCEFCTSPNFWGNKVRISSIERIRHHLGLIRSMGFEELVFQDDNILLWENDLRRSYLYSIAELGFSSFNDAGFYYPLVEERHIEELKEFGVWGTFLPVENQEPEVMHGVQKYMEVDSKNLGMAKLKIVTKWLHNYAIKFYAGIMVGFPGQCAEDLERAVGFGKFVKDLGAEFVTFHFVHPYPGTALYTKYYSSVPDVRRWERCPEYYNFIKPVFPLRNISFDDAEKYINDKFKEINGIEERNPCQRWRA